MFLFLSFLFLFPFVCFFMFVCAREGANARGSEAAKNKWMFETAKLALGQLKPKVICQPRLNKLEQVDV